MKKLITNIQSFLKERRVLVLSMLLAVFLISVFSIFPHITHAEDENEPGWWAGAIMGGIVWVVKGLCLGLLTIFAWILGVTGIGLDLVIKFSIVDMSSFINGAGGGSGRISAINSSWKFFRDLANMFFIFVLTYAGIATMLGLQTTNWKVVLKNIIIAGLLINFSLFFTKIPIDVSNIISIQLYKGISGTGAVNNTGVRDLFSTGISSQFMQYLQTASVYNANELPPTTPNAIADMINIMVATVLGVTIYLITACVFVAMAGMLLMRFLILIYTMIISPIYFLGMILPQAKSFGGKWKDNLIQQCIFPVVLFLLLYVVILFLRTGALSGFNGGDFASGAANRTSKEAIIGLGNLIINYVLIIAMIIGSITVAQAAGAKGGSFMNKRIESLKTAPGRWIAKPIAATTGFAGRKIVGRAANSFANSTIMKKMSAGNFDKGGIKGTLSGVSGMISRNVQGKVKNVGENASFDFRNVADPKLGLGGGVKDGYKKVEKAREDDEKKAKVALEDQRSENEYEKSKNQAAKVNDTHYDEAMLETNKDKVYKVGSGTEWTGEEIKKVREEFAKQLGGRTNAELDKISGAEIDKFATLLTSNQFTHLSGEKSQLTETQKKSLIDKRFSETEAAIKTSNPDEKAKLEKEEAALTASKTTNPLYTSDAAIKKQIDDKITETKAKLKVISDNEKKLFDAIKAFSDKEAEVITERLFARGDKNIIEGFIDNVTQDRSDKLKKLESLTKSQQKTIADRRKEVLKKPLKAATDATKEVADLETSKTTNTQYVSDPTIKKQIDDLIVDAVKKANTARLALRQKIKSSSPAQIANMGAEFITDPEVLDHLDGAHIKEITNKGFGTVNITDPATGVVTTENFNEHFANQVVEGAKSGKNHKVLNALLKEDIAGQYGLDPTETKKAVAIGIRIKTINPTSLTADDKKYIFEEIPVDKLTEVMLTPTEIAQYGSPLNISAAQTKYHVATPTPDQLRNCYIENAVGPRVRILTERANKY